MTIFTGKKVVEGIAISKAFVYKKASYDISDKQISDPQKEWERFLAAQKTAQKDLTDLAAKAKETVGEDEAQIFEIHAMMAEDQDFSDGVHNIIFEDHKSAEYATKETGKQMSDIFSSMDDTYMKARSADIIDVTNRILSILTGTAFSAVLNEECIIFAEDLSPSETVSLDKKLIKGIVTQKGSENSHTAILARTMGIPAIIQADFSFDDIDGTVTTILDGFEAKVYQNPTPEIKKEKLKILEKANDESKELANYIGKPTVTKKGLTIKLYANIGGVEDMQSVLLNDAEGIGLLRSEFLYLGRESLPSEDELFDSYRQIVNEMGGKEVIIRTLDIGADKNADYLGIPKEENPALGFRAIRICLDDPELFKTQLRAILRASKYGRVSIMFPMITSLWEVTESKKLLEEAKQELTAKGIDYDKILVGVMIETPAAVMIVDDLAKEVDFFSVGTNDLTQYTLAVDRQNDRLERFYDPHHPAVLKMLKTVAESAKKHDITAGICGQLAADSTLTQTFIEMGFDELSVVPNSILRLRKQISQLDI